MTSFSELLKKYISENGFTTYSLSQMSGVNRTTIQKAVSSGRIPQPEAFEKILNTLNLSPEERRNLTDAYEYSTDGEYLFLQRRYIKHFLESISIPPPRVIVGI